MVNMSYTRRDIMKSLAYLSGAQALSSCSTLDRILMGESSDLTQSVVIIGAGFSGLVCAYELKRAGIPYVMFEQDTRVGGQILTLNQYFGPGTWVDLGPEFFTSHDAALLSLLRELGIKSQSLMSSRVLPEGVSPAELRALYQSWAKQKNSLEPTTFVTQSLSEWGYALSKDSGWLQALDHWSWYRCGVSSSVISSGRFLDEFKAQGHSPWLTKELSVEGGLGHVVDRLAADIFGTFPEKRLRLGHQLQQIQPSGQNRWDIVFQTSQGRRRYEVKNLILALPPKVLGRIDGVQDRLRLPEQKPSTLALKWAHSSSWQKPYRVWGTEPNWGRGYQKVGAWGQVRAQKFIEMGLCQSLDQVPKRNEGEGLVKNWDLHKGIEGRSVSGVIEPYQVRWSLPDTWYSTYQWDQPHLYQASSLERGVIRARSIVSQILLTRRT